MPTPEWERKFDSLFVSEDRFGAKDELVTSTPELIKSFIRSTVLEAIDEVKVEKIEMHYYPEGIEPKNVHPLQAESWNSARDAYEAKKDKVRKRFI